MRKKVIFASDTSEALDIVARDLGPSALILESRRVRGGVEIVAAFDEESPAALQRKNFNRVMQRLREEPAAPARTGVMRGTPASSEPDRIQTILERLEEISACLKRTESAVQAQSTTGGASALDTLLAAIPLDRLFVELACGAPAARLREADLVLVHGAAGSGKSTAIARIVASLRKSAPTREIVMATADTRKHGAYDTIKHIGQVLNVTVASNDGDVAALARMADQGRTVFVDMPSDLEASLRTARMLSDGVKDRERVASWISVESSSSDNACANVLRGARHLSSTVIITKADEFRPPHSLLTTIARCGARISAYCDGGQTLAPPRSFTRATLESWLADAH